MHNALCMQSWIHQEWLQYQSYSILCMCCVYIYTHILWNNDIAQGPFVSVCVGVYVCTVCVYVRLQVWLCGEESACYVNLENKQTLKINTYKTVHFTFTV